MKKTIITLVIFFGLVGLYFIFNKEDKVLQGVGVNSVTPIIKAVEDPVTQMEVGEYEDYNALDAKEDAELGKVVLFFKASWCPTCKAVDADIMSRLNNIPKGVVIMKVDYDNYSELKKKYGITYQHTFVQIDKDGNMITKWSGSPTLADIISKIK